MLSNPSFLVLYGRSGHFSSASCPASIISLMQMRNGSPESNLLKVKRLKERLGQFSVSPMSLSCASLLLHTYLFKEGNWQAVWIAGESRLFSKVEEESASVLLHCSSSTGSCEGVGRIWSLCSVALVISPASFAYKLCDFEKGGQPLWALVSS